LVNGAFLFKQPKNRIVRRDFLFKIIFPKTVCSAIWFGTSLLAVNAG